MVLRSWLALLRREYLEHRIAFVYFPLGILAILLVAAVSGLTFNRFHFAGDLPLANTLKLFELGYFILIALWLAYLTVTLFFYFGDSFAADRRNNAMLFWKSMPLTDLKILASKLLAGLTVFPMMVLCVAAISGLIYYGALNILVLNVPALVMPSPLQALVSYAQVSGFALVFAFAGVLWYAPFMAWVGALSTVFGRWSLPLAAVIPGLFAVIENLLFFGNGPRGGYIWSYLGKRWSFGLNEIDYGLIVTLPGQFNAGFFLQRLWLEIDWFDMVTGWIFAAVVIWLASEYRRRRLK